MNKLIALSLLLVITLAGAQTTNNNNPQQLPINLTADQGDYDAIAGKATYTGNVVISQGKMNLKGDKVVISLKNGQVDTIEAWGKRASFHYVPVGQPPIDGKAEYMKYHIPSATIDMDKNAWVKQDKNETTAAHLTYNLEKEQVKGSRINMTLIPKTQ